MRIVSDFILKSRINQALELCFMDADYFYLPVYFRLQATFKEKFIFESYENPPLDRFFIRKMIEPDAIARNLDEYFAYLDGNYLKIEKNEKIENLYLLYKSKDNSYNRIELVYQLFWGLFAKPE